MATERDAQIADLPRKLMDAVRRDSLTTADRFAIGQAIEVIQEAAALAAPPVEQQAADMARDGLAPIRTAVERLLTKREKPLDSEVRKVLRFVHAHAGAWIAATPPSPAEQPAPQAGAAESYEDLWNALQAIDTAAVSLPGFEVRHEGGIEAVTKNIVEAIQRVAAHPTEQPSQDAKDAAKWREHVGKLDALVAFCPTCCEGKVASADMTRDEVIFQCGRTSGKSEAARAAQAQGEKGKA